MKKVILTVKGMSCGHCEKRVNEALLALNGVKKSKASSKKSEVVCLFDESVVSLEQIKAAITEAGYGVE